jgi:hypothetical protein
MLLLLMFRWIIVVTASAWIAKATVQTAPAQNTKHRLI